MSTSDTVVTADLSRFGYSELAQAAELLQALSTQGRDFLDTGLTLNFNTHSGCVFLTDEEYRVGMLDSEGALREWFFCPDCGVEGFDGDTHWQDGQTRTMQFEAHEGYCSAKCQAQG